VVVSIIKIRKSNNDLFLFNSLAVVSEPLKRIVEIMSQQNDFTNEFIKKRPTAILIADNRFFKFTKLFPRTRFLFGRLLSWHWENQGDKLS